MYGLKIILKQNKNSKGFSDNEEGKVVANSILTAQSHKVFYKILAILYRTILRVFREFLEFHLIILEHFQIS